MAKEKTILDIRYYSDNENEINAQFAALQDDCLDRSCTDLLCFDYRDSKKSPSIVLWKSFEAADAYFHWDQLPWEESYDENNNILSVPWNNFLEKVADDFSSFTK